MFLIFGFFLLVAFTYFLFKRLKGTWIGELKLENNILFQIKLIRNKYVYLDL